MYSAIAPLVGALITLMYGVNSRFSGQVGNPVATLVIHLAGLGGISLLLLARPEEKKPGRQPFYLYLGGMVGVGTVFTSNYAFAALGASLAVALGLLGQTLSSLVLDATGFLGRKRYPPTARSLPGIGLAFGGVAVLAGDWRLEPLAMLAGLASGAIPVLSVLLNSELGRRKGIFRSTRTNYIMGLATSLAIVAAYRLPFAASARAVLVAGPVLALSGGLMGIVVVAAMSLIFPRIPAFSATLLMFSGQALSGVLIDLVADGSFEPRKLAGSILVLSGLGVNALLSRSRAPA
ncbi:MAG TPA: DMT family transporter [Rectinemataceae bacterium]|nr:DMT family transporter [Rectinemataceae bacterium]